MARSKRDSVIALLAADVRPADIATRVGVGESYVSNISSDEIAQIQISRLKSGNVSASVDNMYTSLEERALVLIDQNLAAFTKPSHLLSLAKVLNSAKRRSVGETDVGTGGTTINQQVVNLNLPDVSFTNAPTFKKNSNNEIIEVDGREMRTFDSSKLSQLAETVEAEAAEDELLSPEKLELYQEYLQGEMEETINSEDMLADAKLDSMSLKKMLEDVSPDEMVALF